MLGLDVNAASFAEGIVAANTLEKAFDVVKDAVVEAVNGLRELILGTAEARTQIADMAVRTGVSTDAIQQLSYAAGFSGVGMEELGQSLNYLAHQGVRDVKEEFLKLADQLHKMPADGRRADLAMEKFGRGAGKLVPILTKGRQELEALFEEAPVASKEAIEASAHFTDTLNAISVSSKGVWGALATPLIDAISPLVDQIRAWQKANQALIKAKMKEWGEAAGRAIRFMWKAFLALRDAGIAVMGVLKPLAVLIGSLLTAAIILNTGAIWVWISSMAMAAAMSWGMGAAARAAGIQATLAWLKAAAPLVLLGALLFMAYALFEDLYYSITENDGVLADFWATITDSDVAFWFKGFIKTVKGFFDWLGSIGLGAIFSNAWTAWKTGFVEFFGWLVGKIRSIPGVEWALKKFGGGAAAAPASTPSVPAPAGMSPVTASGLFGGGASPGASAANSNMSPVKQPLVFQPQVSNQFTINQQPGQDGVWLANKTAEKQGDVNQRMLNEAHAAVRP